MRPCVFFDLDSTLSDSRQRRHLIADNHEDTDWVAYSLAAGDDLPVPGTVAMARALAPTHDLYIVTGRSEEAWEVTLDWLARHDLDLFADVFMRGTSDRTSNAEHKVKVMREWMDVHEREISFLVEDWPKVADAVYAELGIPVVLVNPRYDEEPT